MDEGCISTIFWKDWLDTDKYWKLNDTKAKNIPLKGHEWMNIYESDIISPFVLLMKPILTQTIKNNKTLFQSFER